MFESRREIDEYIAEERVILFCRDNELLGLALLTRTISGSSRGSTMSNRTSGWGIGVRDGTGVSVGVSEGSKVSVAVAVSSGVPLAVAVAVGVAVGVMVGGFVGVAVRVCDPPVRTEEVNWNCETHLY